MIFTHILHSGVYGDLLDMNHHHHQMNPERVSGKNRNAVNLEKQRDVVCEMRDEAHEKAENKSDSSVRNSINTQKQKHR